MNVSLFCRFVWDGYWSVLICVPQMTHASSMVMTMEGWGHTHREEKGLDIDMGWLWWVGSFKYMCASDDSCIIVTWLILRCRHDEGRTHIKKRNFLKRDVQKRPNIWKETYKKGLLTLSHYPALSLTCWHDEGRTDAVGLGWQLRIHIRLFWHVIGLFSCIYTSLLA